MLTDETETGIKFRAEMAQQQFQEFVHQQQVRSLNTGYRGERVRQGGWYGARARTCAGGGAHFPSTLAPAPHFHRPTPPHGLNNRRRDVEEAAEAPS